MGETERAKAISETGQESQTEDECSGQSQTLSQNENDLGQEKRQEVEVQITGGPGSGEFPPKEAQINQTGFLAPMDVEPDFGSCRVATIAGK